MVEASRSSQYRSLVIEADLGCPLYIVSQALVALDHAYNYIEVARILMDTPYGLGRWNDLNVFEPQGRFGRWVAKRDRLVLKSVDIRSPGIFKVVGKVFSLEQIRLWLNDRHEREKDRKYRNEAERKRLQLENEIRAIAIEKEKVALADAAARQFQGVQSRSLDIKLKEASVVKKQLEIARSHGAGDEVLNAVVRNFLLQPLQNLDPFQDAGLLKSASFEANPLPGSEDENKDIEESR